MEGGKSFHYLTKKGGGDFKKGGGRRARKVLPCLEGGTQQHLDSLFFHVLAHKGTTIFEVDLTWGT